MSVSGTAEGKTWLTEMGLCHRDKSGGILKELIWHGRGGGNISITLGLGLGSVSVLI